MRTLQSLDLRGKERRSSFQKRAAKLLTLAALLSGSAFSQSSFIVNSYYGDANGTTPLSTLISTGATARLTHLTYAFATSDGTSNPCTGAPSSILSTDLQNLKAQNSNLKILISVGGATAYGAFVNATATPTGITNFANACVATLISSFPGYIDGIDIDWEFPQNTTDEQHFNALLGAFRTALNNYATAHSISEHLLLTAAIGPESTTNGWQFIDFSGQTYTPAANSSVDFYNVEFYNYAYDSDPVTQSNAPIHQINNDIFGNANAYGAAGLVPVGKVPAGKIVVGIPFYGVHYTNVTSGAQLGGSGNLVDPNTASGTPTYAQIVNTINASPGTYATYSDTDGSAWAWASSTGDFFEYDNPATIAQKISYAMTNQLGGVFAWNLLDDTTTATLLSAMASPATNVDGMVSLTSTGGMTYNKLKKVGSETFVITNTSGHSIAGPIELVVSNLTGATAVGNTGTSGGKPYWTVSSGSLAATSSVTITIQFSYTGATPTFSQSVYSGSLQ